MKKQLKKRLVIPVAIALVAILAVSGVAYAYWTAGGSGTGTGSAAAGVTVTVNQTTTLSQMYPGDAIQTISGNFTNTTGAPVLVPSVSFAGLTTSNPGCTGADFLLGGSAPVGVQVPVGSGVGSWTGLTIRFNNDPSRDQNACKSVTVTLTYSIP